MQPIDNSQFTEEQRTEAFRREVMQHLMRQSKALDSIRSIMIAFTILFIIGAVMWILVAVSSSSGGLG